jgi:ParB/RepB/Spo0J family partition protein
MSQLLLKPLTWFKPDPNQPRQSFNDAEDRALGESMKTHGQLQPVGAKPDGALLWGGRRHRAAQLAGITELSVIVTDKVLTDAEIKTIQLTENLHRANLAAYDRWLACEGLMSMKPEWQAKDLSEHLTVDASTVVRWLCPSRCTDDVKEALKAGRIGISDCYAISKLPLQEQAGLLALKLAGATRDQIERQGRKQRNGTPAVRTDRIKCPLPCGTMVQVAGQNLGLDDVIEAMAAVLKQARKASEQGLDVKTFERVCKDQAKAQQS